MSEYFLNIVEKEFKHFGVNMHFRFIYCCYTVTKDGRLKLQTDLSFLMGRYIKDFLLLT